MRPTRSWEMRKREGGMTACSMREILMTILLPFSGSFLKGVLIRKGAGVAGEKALGKEVVVDGNTQIKFLKPGDQPEAEFEISGSNITAREYCTVHGLWSVKG